MLFLSILLLLPLLGLETLAAPSFPSQPKQVVTATATPPHIRYLLTVTVGVAKPLEPIAIPGGDNLVEPLTNGTIVGAINGTIQGGLAYPQRYNNNTLSVPNLEIYGTTVDRYPFFVTASEAGFGDAQSQIIRAKVEIGGPYTYINTTFILATISANAARAIVTVQAFAVTL
ncbi:hypothetical protein MMC06_001890 [Schaereria dolodes]|nr:hypothetical protein [Schaereria dolodes]